MIKIFSSLFLCLLAEHGLASTASSVDLSATADADGYYTVSIEGSNFGESPNIVVFDDFNSQTLGETVRLDESLIGKWTRSSSYPSLPKIVKNGESNAIQIHDFGKEDTAKIAQIEAVFSTKVSDIFISYSVMVPEGKFFAGANEDFVFPDRSTWKFTWITDTPEGIGSQTLFNICTPTHGGKGSFLLAGNSVNHGWIDMKPSWSWHEKNYMSFGLQPHKVAAKLLPGYMFFTLTGKKDRPLFWSKKNAPVFPITNSDSFDRVKFPGWFGNGDMSNFDAYYDDIYVATGENAFARVEISDNMEITKSALNLTMPVISWTQNQIEFKLHKSIIQKNIPYFVRIYDKNNNSSAYRLTCGNCPRAPIPI